MAKNYVEEFFIAIGFDTDRVKKESKEIDKILDGVVRKKRDKTNQETKIQTKAHKLARQSEADNFKFFLKQEKAKQDEIRKTEEILSARERKANQRKANQETKIQTKAHKLARQSEADNFKFFLKQEKAKQDQIRKTEEMLLARERKAHAFAASIRRSSAFQNLQQRGRLGDIEGKITQAVKDFVRTGDLEGFKNLKSEVTRTNAAMNQLIRTQVGLHTVQGGLSDSTRNLIRSYASLFAVLQGTTAIKRVGQDFQGMQASMLAASGSPEQAGKDIEFINGMVDEMGLSLKDTTEAFVKFKFAAKGKMDQGQIEELFEGVSQFGTALKVAPEDMKRAQKALSQMMSKGVVMSRFLDSY